MITAVESTITGPFTSKLPLTAPATTQEEAAISPITTVPAAILTQPLLVIPPSSLLVCKYTSAAEDLPLTAPEIESLPRQLISPLTVPYTSKEPSETMLPCITVPFDITVVLPSASANSPGWLSTVTVSAPMSPV